MSTYHCYPISHPIDAEVTLPGSKSITNRALVMAALADGSSLLNGILLADDTRLMIDALRTLGVAITVDEDEHVAEITGCRGSISVDEARLSCGNAGTVLRFCTAVATLCRGRIELDGVARMQQRPIGALAEILGVLGSGIEWLGEPGFPPLVVHGNGLRGGHVEFASPPSSQFVSALLQVAPYATGDLLIDVSGDVPSQPYLRMTMALMAKFGVSVIEQYKQRQAQFVVPAFQRYQGQTLAIEPDASNATYFLAAPAVTGGRVTVTHLGTDSIQGDARFVDVLEMMGCRVEREPGSLTVTGPTHDQRLVGVEIDLNDMPDTVQTLAVLALFADGPTSIRNVANLRIKETDRLAALAVELTKLGAVVEERDDGLTIHPPNTPKSASIATYDDHRMAMSFALAGLSIPGLVIENPSCTAKTFPDFFDRFGELA